MIKLAVFDWNATLLDDMVLTLQATNHEFALVGKPPFGMETLVEHFEVPLKNYYRNIGLDPDQVESHAHARHRAFHEVYEAGINQTHTRPGAEEVLREFEKRGIVNIILSNHHVRGIREQLERLGLSHYFEAILANDDIEGALHMGKQARLEAYLRISHIKAEDSCIIGDTSEEVVIGKELGLKTVAITGGMYSRKRLEAAKPDVLIDSLRDLMKVVETL